MNWDLLRRGGYSPAGPLPRLPLPECLPFVAAAAAGDDAAALLLHSDDGCLNLSDYLNPPIRVRDSSEQRLKRKTTTHDLHLALRVL